MGSVVDAIEGLDPSIRGRVIEWAAKRYGVATLPARQSGPPALGGGGGEGEEELGAAQFRHFTDLLDATSSPATEADRALVGGYWFQVIRGNETFAGLDVNNELKNAGHGSRNITDALTTLQQRKPAYVRQIAKAGRTRQARKTYKLTVAGIRAVEAMMGSGATGGVDDEG